MFGGKVMRKQPVALALMCALFFLMGLYSLDAKAQNNQQDEVVQIPDGIRTPEVCRNKGFEVNYGVASSGEYLILLVSACDNCTITGGSVVRPSPLGWGGSGGNFSAFVNNVKSGSHTGKFAGNLSCEGKGDGEPPEWGGTAVACAVAEWKETATFSFSMPENINSKIESAINTIPRVENVSIDETTISASAASRDCCQGSKLKIDGERYAEGEVELSADIGGIEIAGDSVTERLIISGTGVGVKVRATLRALVTADFTVKGKAGRRKDECDSKDCFYGELAANPSISLKTEVAAGGCTIIGSDTSCGTLEAEPVGVTGNLVGSVRTNSTKKQCDEGVTGDLTLDSVTANGSFSFGSYN
jgi:hypothetical protein